MDITTIIIGAGPAGVAAAVHMQRAGSDFLLIEKSCVGGLLKNANLVENFPGIVPGMTGIDLAKRFEGHLRRLKIGIAKEEVIHAGKAGNGFAVATAGRKYGCRNLIVAAGTTAKKLTFSKMEDKRVFYEVYPLRNVEGKRIAVIGGGDAAFDYALNLARRNRVSIIFRGDRPKCLPLLHERARRTRAITICPGQTWPAADAFDLVVAAIGREPNTGFLSPELKNHFLAKSDIRGLYFAGDIKRGINRQAIIAAADGLAAAAAIIMAN
jgi:thioredoxin reductase